MATTIASFVPLDAVITPFLKKLLSLTSSVPPNIGGWDPKGTVFIVLDGTAFEALLRNYFKGTLQTFIRQLHFYGFSKTDLPRLGQTSWSFSHPCFLRDSPHLIAEIKRKSSSNSTSTSNTTNFPTPTPAVVMTTAAASIVGKQQMQFQHQHMLNSINLMKPPQMQHQVQLYTQFQKPPQQPNMAEVLKNTALEAEVKDLKEKVKMLQETVDKLVGYISEEKMTTQNKKRKIEHNYSPSIPVLNNNAIADLGEFAGLPLMDSCVPLTFPKVKQEDEEAANYSLADDLIKDLASGGFPEDTDLQKPSNIMSEPPLSSSISWQQQFFLSQQQQQQPTHQQLF